MQNISVNHNFKTEFKLYMLRKNCNWELMWLICIDSKMWYQMLIKTKFPQQQAPSP